MRHHHHHHDVHGGADRGERRLLFSIALNVCIAAIQFIGGLLSGSLALISDALHNATDASSLGVSYGARRISRRSATSSKTFGYRRAEIIGAFANLIVLVLVAFYLIMEAAERLFDPRTVDGTTMIVIAGIGAIANVAISAVLHRDAQESLNIRSAYLHNVTDAASSAAVVVGGILILWWGFVWIDPVLTLLIAAYILYHSYGMLRETVNILMESAPGDLDVEEVRSEIMKLPAIQDVHHVHVWQLDDEHNALEAHIVIDEDDLRQMERIKRRAKTLISRRYGIEHSTLEFELVPCEHPETNRCYANDVQDEV